MSVKLMTRVWSLDLSHPKQSVLLVMADQAHDDGFASPGVRYVAWKTGYSPRQVQRVMEDLQADGLVECVSAPYRNHATEYQLHLERGIEKRPFEPKRRRKPTEDNMSAQVQLDGETSGADGRTSAPSTEDMAVPGNGALTEDLPTYRPSTPLAAAPHRSASDPLWDVLEELYGAAPKARGPRGGWQEAHASLRADGATPTQVRAWVRSLRGSRKNWAVVTVNALAKHFHRLGPDPLEDSNGVSARQLYNRAAVSAMTGDDEGPHSVEELIQQKMDALHELEVAGEESRSAAVGSATPRSLPPSGPPERNGGAVRHSARDA